MKNVNKAGTFPRYKHIIRNARLFANIKHVWRKFKVELLFLCAETMSLNAFAWDSHRGM